MCWLEEDLFRSSEINGSVCNFGKKICSLMDRGIFANTVSDERGVIKTNPRSSMRRRYLRDSTTWHRARPSPVAPRNYLGVSDISFGFYHNS